MSIDNPVVIDLGSGVSKLVMPTMYQMHREPESSRLPGSTSNSGATAQARWCSRTDRLVDKGYIANFDYLESMLHYLLYEQLGWVKGEEGSVLFVEPLFTGKSERERLAKLMFEEFNVAGLFLHDAGCLSPVSTGKMAGCVVDIGHGKVDVAAVSEGITQAQGQLV